MSIENLHEGLGILIAHGNSGHNLGADHDALYISGADEVKGMSLSTHRRLKNLGFHLRAEDQHWECFI